MKILLENKAFADPVDLVGISPLYLAVKA